MAQTIIVAKLQAKAGREKELEQALSDVVDETHAEPGCVVYALQRSADDPTRYAIIEGWASAEAYDAHVATPYVAKLIDRLGELLAGEPDLETFQPMNVGDTHKGALGASAS